MAYVRMCVCIWTCVCVCSFFRFAFVCSLEIHSDFDCWNTSVVSFQWVILYDERWNRRVTVPSSLISYHSTHTLSLTHPHKHTSNAGERLSLWKATVRKTWQQHPVQSTSPDKKSQQGMPITGNECFLNPMHPRIKSLGKPSHTHTHRKHQHQYLALWMREWKRKYDKIRSLANANRRIYVYAYNIWQNSGWGRCISNAIS